MERARSRCWRSRSRCDGGAGRTYLARSWWRHENPIRRGQGGACRAGLEIAPGCGPARWRRCRRRAALRAGSRTPTRGGSRLRRAGSARLCRGGEGEIRLRYAEALFDAGRVEGAPCHRRRGPACTRGPATIVDVAWRQRFLHEVQTKLPHPSPRRISPRRRRASRAPIKADRLARDASHALRSGRSGCPITKARASARARSFWPLRTRASIRSAAAAGRKVPAG